MEEEGKERKGGKKGHLKNEWKEKYRKGRIKKQIWESETIMAEEIKETRKWEMKRNQEWRKRKKAEEKKERRNLERERS